MAPHASHASAASVETATQFLTEHPRTLRILATRIAMIIRLPKFLTLEDLVQEGAMSLLDAAQRYDPTRGPSFAFYAELHARYAMLDAVRYARGSRARGLVLLPVDIIRKQLAQNASWHTPEWADWMDPRTNRTTAPIQELEREDWLSKAICKLPHILQEVLYWIYIKDQPIKDLGDLWGVSESRISQMHTEAKQRMAKLLRPDRP